MKNRENMGNGQSELLSPIEGLGHTLVAALADGRMREGWASLSRKGIEKLLLITVTVSLLLSACSPTSSPGGEVTEASSTSTALVTPVMGTPTRPRATETATETITMTSTPEKPTDRILASTTASWDWVWNGGGGVAMSQNRTYVEWGKDSESAGFRIAYVDGLFGKTWAIMVDRRRQSLWWLGQGLEMETRSDGTTEYYLNSLVYQGITSENQESFLWRVRLPLSKLSVQWGEGDMVDGFSGEEEARAMYAKLLTDNGEVGQLMKILFGIMDNCDFYKYYGGPEKACRRILEENGGAPFAPGTEELRAYFYDLWVTARDSAGVVGDEAIKEFLASGADWQNSPLVPLVDPTDKLAAELHH